MIDNDEKELEYDNLVGTIRFGRHIAVIFRFEIAAGLIVHLVEMINVVVYCRYEQIFFGETFDGLFFGEVDEFVEKIGRKCDYQALKSFQFYESS